MTSMNIPEPVMSLAIMPKTREASGSFSKALSRFQKEDPTFKVRAYCLITTVRPVSNAPVSHLAARRSQCPYLSLEKDGCRSAQTQRQDRLSSVAWESCIWRSM